MQHKWHLLGFLLAITSIFPIRFAQAYSIGSEIAIVLLALPAYYALIRAYKWRAVYAIGALSVFAVFIETVGIYTGFPYGGFHYETLGFKLFGLTPWTVFFAFTPLVLGAVYYAKRMTQKYMFIATVALLVYIDLLLDPVAAAIGFWSWHTPGMYYGIPFTNYLGWIFSGIIATGIYMLFLGNNTTHGQEISFYLSTWLWTGASAYLGMWIPFLLGIIGITYVLLNTSEKDSKRFG